MALQRIYNPRERPSSRRPRHKAGRSLRDFLKPFNIVSLALAIFGIAYGVVAQREPGISYQVKGLSSPIFNSGQASDSLRLVGPGGARVDQNVYLSEVVLWNSGDLPIEPEEMRVPLRLVFDGGSRVLDYRIVNESRREVTDFSVSHDSVPGALRISWKHFDPGLGVRVQVLYSGRDSADARLDGYAVGVRAFTRVGADVNEVSRADVVAGFVMGFFLFSGAVISFRKAYHGSIRFQVPKVRRRAVGNAISGGLICAFFGAVIVWILYNGLAHAPPL